MTYDAEIRLPAFNSRVTPANGNPAASLANHARAMAGAAGKLTMIASLIEGKEVTLQPAFDCIRLTGPQELMDRLINDGLAYSPIADDANADDIGFDAAADDTGFDVDDEDDEYDFI